MTGVSCLDSLRTGIGSGSCKVFTGELTDLRTVSGCASVYPRQPTLSQSCPVKIAAPSPKMCPTSTGGTVFSSTWG